MSHNGNCENCDEPRRTKSISTKKIRDGAAWPEKRINLCDNCLRMLRLDNPGNPGLYEKKCQLKTEVKQDEI